MCFILSFLLCSKIICQKVLISLLQMNIKIMKIKIMNIKTSSYYLMTFHFYHKYSINYYTTVSYQMKFIIIRTLMELQK